MILNKPGETFEYEGRKFMIGDQIIANGKSVYEGLFGTITETRDGEDKETENETPDLYCRFEEPDTPYEVKLNAAMARLARLHRFRDMLWDTLSNEEELYHQILFIVEDAIQRQNDEIAILRGAKIEKTHKRKRYVFEVSRNRIGAADVYLNGELVANMLDEVVDAVEPENIQTDIVKGKGSTIPDAVFVKSVLYSLGDAVCRLSDRVKAILDRDIPEEVREKLQENLRRAKP